MDGKYNVKIVKLLSSIYAYIVLIICAATTFFSLSGSTYYDTYMQNETPSYSSDNIIVILIGLSVWSIVLWGLLLIDRKKHFSRRGGTLIACVFAFFMSMVVIVVFNCGVTSDAGLVNELALQFIDGDYSSFLSQDYFIVCPHQIHMAFYYVAVYYIFGINNYLAFKVINAVCIAIVVYFLQEMSYLITGDELISKISSFIAIALFPLFLYATYIYGDVPGYTLAIAGIYMSMQFIKNNQWRYIILASILFCIARVVKENVQVFLLADIIILILLAFYKRNWKYTIAVCLICVFSLAGTFCVDMYCCKRANIDSMPSGAPKEAWIAMGMEEGICGAGGFNGEFWQIMRDNNYQYDLAKEVSVDKIKENLSYFIDNPIIALKFYYRKYILQWNDPSFSALINIEWTSRHRDSNQLSDFLLYGKGRGVLLELLNISHFIILLFSTIGIKRFIKNWSLEGALILLVVFGGVLFHELLWEVKGRYALFYYVLLVPFAAIGFNYFFLSIKDKMVKWKNVREGE